MSIAEAATNANFFTNIFFPAQVRVVSNDEEYFKIHRSSTEARNPSPRAPSRDRERVNGPLGAWRRLALGLGESRKGRLAFFLQGGDALGQIGAEKSHHLERQRCVEGRAGHAQPVVER